MAKTNKVNLKNKRRKKEIISILWSSLNDKHSFLIKDLG